MWQVSQLLTKVEKKQQKNLKQKPTMWKGGRRGNSWIPHEQLDLWARNCTRLRVAIFPAKDKSSSGAGQEPAPWVGSCSHTRGLHCCQQNTDSTNSSASTPPSPLLHFVKISSLYTQPASHFGKKADKKYLRKSKTDWNWDFGFSLWEFCAQSRWVNAKFSRSTESLMQDQRKPERSVFNR